MMIVICIQTQRLCGKSAHGVSGLGTALDPKLYFTRDIPENKWVPKHLLAPISEKPAAKNAKPPPQGAAQIIPVWSGEYVQEFKMKRTRTKNFYMEPGSQ